MGKFSIIIAVDSLNGIGKNGTLAWSIPEDMKFFKELTSQTKKNHRQNAVIMGRKTWESIPEKYRPLPGRLNCILSSQYSTKNPEKIDSSTYGFGDFSSCHTFVSKRRDVEQVFIIGGSYLYNLVLDHPCLDKIYLTKVYNDFNCDVFFSDMPHDFKEISKSEKKKHKDIEYQFFVYKKKQGYISKYLGFLFSKNRCL